MAPSESHQRIRSYFLVHLLYDIHRTPTVSALMKFHPWFIRGCSFLASCSVPWIRLLSSVFDSGKRLILLSSACSVWAVSAEKLSDGRPLEWGSENNTASVDSDRFLYHNSLNLHIMQNAYYALRTTHAENYADLHVWSIIYEFLYNYFFTPQ